MADYIVKAEGLKKWFSVRMGFFQSVLGGKQLYVRAVDGIDLQLEKGEVYGLAGESGSGKTTTGRLLLRLIEPTAGKIFFRDTEIGSISEAKLKPFRRKMQIIFQDPYESLDPRKTVRSIVEEPLIIQGIVGKEAEDKLNKVMKDVALVPQEQFFFRYPHELSGGQRQRVAVARALVLDPEFIVADEPVSMLDVSIRAEVLNLMTDLRDKYNVAFLYITHDLALARHICDKITVMYLGKVVEKGSSDDVIMKPLHPYTQALIAAVPIPDPTSRRIQVVIKGEIPSPINPPSGCRFHTRCPVMIGEICRTKEPALLEAEKDHYVACHLHSK
jgi:peptide/nickel transport system ATP-binding protein